MPEPVARVVATARHAFFPEADAAGAWRNRLVAVCGRSLDRASVRTVREGARAYGSRRAADAVARLALAGVAHEGSTDRLPDGHPTRRDR